MQSDKKRSKFLLRVMLVQFAAVLVVLLVLFAVKSINPSDYKAIADKYIAVADTKDTEEALDTAAARIKAYLLDDKTDKNAGGKDVKTSGREYPKGCSASKYIISEDVVIPVNGYISSPFGYRINPVTKKLSFHTGIDIAADTGTPVYAAYYGVVEEAGKNDVYGYYILLNHGNGIQTFYGHCSKLLAEAGDIVKEGTKIALVGSTGWSTGPHCHFEIRINGVKYNPAYVVKLDEN